MDKGTVYVSILPISAHELYTILVFVFKISVTVEAMNVNKDWITISGFSSGGTFAQQLQFSYSSLFSGIGVFSHGIIISLLILCVNIITYMQ